MEEQRPRAADDFATIRARMEEITERRPRAADDFAAIRARLTELRRERERAEKAAHSAEEERADEPRWLVSVKRRGFSEF
jgi:hypothetical protein